MALPQKVLFLLCPNAVFARRCRLRQEKMRPTAKWDAFQIAHMQLYKYYSLSQRIRRENAAAAAKAAAENNFKQYKNAMRSQKHLCAICKHSTPLPCRCQHARTAAAHPHESGQFLCGLLVDIGPHRVAAARQRAPARTTAYSASYKRRHIGQQQPDRGAGRGTGQDARRPPSAPHRRRSTAHSTGQRPAARRASPA